jgi:WD40 repeat protein
VPSAPRQSAFGTFKEVAELTGHAASITNVKTSHSGELILTAGNDGTARLWDLKTIYSPNTPLEKIDGRYTYQAAAVSPLGDRAVTVGRTVHLWDTKTGAHLAVLREKDTGAKGERGFHSMRAVFSRTGKLILIDREDNDDQRFAELYLSSGIFLARLPGSINAAPDSAISHDDRLIALASGNDGLIWSTAENRVVKKLTGHVNEVASIAFSPNGKRLITVGEDGSARLWSFPEGRALEKVQISSEKLYDTAFSPNGRYAFIIEVSNKQWLWDTIGHKVIRLREHEQAVMQWGFSDDSTLLFTTDMSEKTLIHATSDGRLQTTLTVGVLAFTGNSNFLLDTQLRVWNTKTGRLFSSPVGPGLLVKALNLTADNQLTAITDSNAIVHRALYETSSMNTLLSIAEKRTRKASPQNQKPPH